MDKSLNGFIAFLEAQVKNHSIYVWGAQGQGKSTISESWIKSKETSAENAQKAIQYWQKQVKAGYGDDLRAYDCSGLGMYFIQNLTGLSKNDMSANSMKAKCETISRANVRSGDWVFRVYTSGSNKGRAYHIGYVVDSALNVIEAKGRSYGVVKMHIDQSKGYWNAFGRPSFFAGEIFTPKPVDPPKNPGWEAARIMKLTLIYMRGDDVRGLQEALLTRGYELGSGGADGVFGSWTNAAVRKFQSENGLKVDGKAGEDTVTALGGVWKASTFDNA